MEIQEDGDPAATQPASTANDVDAGSAAAAGSDVVMATAPPAPALADEDSLDLEMAWPGRAGPFRARPRQSAALSGDVLHAAQAAWDLLDKTPERQAIRRLRQQRQQQMHERQQQHSVRWTTVIVACVHDNTTLIRSQAIAVRAPYRTVL